MSKDNAKLFTFLSELQNLEFSRTGEYNLQKRFGISETELHRIVKQIKQARQEAGTTC